MTQFLDDIVNTTVTSANIELFAEQLNSSYSMDIAEIISKKPFEEGIIVFNALGEGMAVKAFGYLRFGIQAEILKTLPSKRVASLLNALAPDDRTALLEELPVALVNLLLKYLSPQERALSLRLLNYPEHSIGRLMTPDYIAVKMDWTIRQVLDYIRANGKDSETINVIYAVDDEGRLVDDFRIRQLLFASLDTRISEIGDYKYIALQVDDDEEVAINIFRKYERLALPVLDKERMLLGIVTIDDIIAVATKEDTEDIQKMGGTLALDGPYMEASLYSLFRKRAGWLVLLFLGEMLTASAMGYFEDEIAKAVVLALFIPLIISSGGNAGSQASTLIIRAMALGEVTLGDWWRIMRREIIVSLFLGIVLGLVGFFRISVWTIFSDVYGAHAFLVALTIFCAIVGVVMWGALCGSMLPLFLKRLKFDPAASSAPLVATLVDVTGLIIYFSIAMFILRGTLL